MNTTTLKERAAETAVEHFDVLIVGAGISGVGAAWRLTTKRPNDSFVVLEKMDGFGGTWLSHKYPGIRSDSDLYTFGYDFKPWVGPPIATAQEILTYMGEVIEENDLGRHIRYGHTIRKATWSTAENRWTIEAVKNATGEKVTITANFLWMAQGYYRHEAGYTPEWEGMEDYQGKIIHPQTWPEDLDYKGKNVVIIGSGATAATVLPAIADDVKHVTLLQRSPTYFIPGRNANELADILRELKIDETWIHEIVRRKLLHDQALFTERSVNESDLVREELLAGVRAFVGDEVVKEHFTPSYRPWRQRIAFVPDGDLFQAVIKGQASVVTDEIDRFTPEGIRLKSGRELKADIIVTATGFNLSALGDIEFVVDSKPLDFHDTVTWRGMMFTGVPNMVWVMGYFRASWTLRADLVADFVCRMLDHMQARQAHKVEVALRPEDKDMKLLDWIDEENFNPGYLMRGVHLWPRRGEKPEWQHSQDYWTEKDVIPTIDLDGPEFKYS